MKANNIWFVIIASAILLQGCATEQSVVKASQSPYREMVAQLTAGKRNVDYTALRLAYAATDEYAPYTGAELKREMFTAFAAHDYLRARSLADTILRSNFADFSAHDVASAAAAELGDAAQATFHGTIARGLMQSISSRSGRSLEDAILVITGAEEYAFLRVHGWERISQGLGECLGKPCDHLQVRDLKTGEMFDLHFDISIPYTWLQKKIGAQCCKR